MRIFHDPDAFDPNRDSKMPVRRGPVWLLLRANVVFFSLILSSHPADAWTWVRSMRARRRPLSMAIPWLTFGAIRKIRQLLPKQAQVFEFGSGHSTRYWIEHGAHLTSVEDDAGWYELLGKDLAARGLRGYSLIHAPTLEQYLGALDGIEHESQDLILVDGAHRRNCVSAAVPYVKPGGLLVVDNTDWHWFRDYPIEGIPSRWKKHAFPGYGPMIGHISETTIWQRPPEEVEFAQRPVSSGQ